jgi:hypothetical protein
VHPVHPVPPPAPIAALLGLLLQLAPSAQAAPVVVAPAASAADIPALADLLDRAGWTPTPELSGVYRVGSIFLADGDQHSLMLRSCFDAPAAVDTYTSMELTSSLQAGVRVRAGLFSARGEAGLVRQMRFGVPEHHTLERLAMQPTEDCADRLRRAPADARAQMYAVQEVLTAEIAEQTCGRLDAQGRFVGLGAADVELQRACTQVSLEPVAVAYRIVQVEALDLGTAPPSSAPAPVQNWDPNCIWGTPRTVSSTMTTLTINGETLDVRGEEQRTRIQHAMQACGRPEAAKAFAIWRQQRRTVNIAGATIFGMFPFGIGIAAAYQAEDWRLRMERLLLDPKVADERKGRGWRKKVR